MTGPAGDFTRGPPARQADHGGSDGSLSLGKAGVRTLVTLLDQEYGTSGVHVASITVAGPVAPGTNFDPDDIAEHYWRLHTQPRHQWEREILYAG